MKNVQGEAAGFSLQGILRGYPWQIGGMCFSPDGQRLIVPAERATTVDTWDLSSFEKSSSLSLNISSEKSSPLLLNISSEKSSPVFLNIGRSAMLALAPDWSTVAVSKAESVVHIWSLTGVPLAELAGHAAPISDLVFSRDGTYLLVLDNLQIVHLWHLPAQREVLAFPIRFPTDPEARLTYGAFLALSPEDNVLITHDRVPQGNIRVWQLDLGQARVTWRGDFWAHEPRVLSLFFDPTGQRVCTINTEHHLNDVRLYDGQTFAFLERLRLPVAWEFELEIVDCAFSPDGRFLALTDGQGKPGIWDTLLHRPQASLQAFPPIPEDGGSFYTSSQVLWSPAGQLLATSGWEPKDLVRAQQRGSKDDFVVKIWAFQPDDE